MYKLLDRKDPSLSRKEQSKLQHTNLETIKRSFQHMSTVSYSLNTEDSSSFVPPSINAPACHVPTALGPKCTVAPPKDWEGSGIQTHRDLNQSNSDSASTKNRPSKPLSPTQGFTRRAESRHRRSLFAKLLRSVKNQVTPMMASLLTIIIILKYVQWKNLCLCQIWEATLQTVWANGTIVKVKNTSWLRSLHPYSF